MLGSDGVVVPVGGPVGGWVGGIDHVVGRFATSLFERQQNQPFVSMPNRENGVALKGMAESGQIKPVIDRTYPLAEAAEAMAYVGEGHARGKVVIVVENGAET